MWMLKQIITHSYEEVIEMLFSEEQTSVFEDYRDFKVLILRRISVSDEKIHFVPEAFVIRENSIYHFNRKSQQLELLKNDFQDLLTRLEKIYQHNQKIIISYSSQVEELEDYLFARNTPRYFMDLWFDLKKDLSRIKNYFFRNSVVYREFYKNAHESFKNLLDEYKDVEENIDFQMSTIDTLVGRLDGVYKYFESIKADRLNKTLLSLTMISGVFLPLNLIVGFFGMNTPALFFLEDPKGTHKVIMVLVAVLLTILLGIKVVQLIDRFFLRFVLGRYNFYKKLTSNIEDLGTRLRGH